MQHDGPEPVVPLTGAWIRSIWIGYMFREGNAGRKNERGSSYWRSVCQCSFWRGETGRIGPSCVQETGSGVDFVGSRSMRVTHEPTRRRVRLYG